MQPERGALLPMRRRLNTYANFRPVSLPKALGHFSPLKSEVIGEGIDLIMVRELVGGLYFGSKEVGVNAEGKRYVTEALEYDEDQIRRILLEAGGDDADYHFFYNKIYKIYNIEKLKIITSNSLF